MAKNKNQANAKKKAKQHAKKAARQRVLDLQRHQERFQGKSFVSNSLKSTPSVADILRKEINSPEAKVYNRAPKLASLNTTHLAVLSSKSASANEANAETVVRSSSLSISVPDSHIFLHLGKDAQSSHYTLAVLGKELNFTKTELENSKGDGLNIAEYHLQFSDPEVKKWLLALADSESLINYSNNTHQAKLSDKIFIDTPFSLQKVNQGSVAVTASSTTSEQDLDSSSLTVSDVRSLRKLPQANNSGMSQFPVKSDAVSVISIRDNQAEQQLTKFDQTQVICIDIKSDKPSTQLTTTQIPTTQIKPRTPATDTGLFTDGDNPIQVTIAPKKTTVAKEVKESSQQQELDRKTKWFNAGSSQVVEPEVETNSGAGKAEEPETPTIPQGSLSEYLSGMGGISKNFNMNPISLQTGNINVLPDAQLHTTKPSSDKVEATEETKETKNTSSKSKEVASTTSAVKAKEGKKSLSKASDDPKVAKETKAEKGEKVAKASTSKATSAKGTKSSKSSKSAKADDYSFFNPFVGLELPQAELGSAEFFTQLKAQLADVKALQAQFPAVEPTEYLLPTLKASTFEKVNAEKPVKAPSYTGKARTEFVQALETYHPSTQAATSEISFGGMVPPAYNYRRTKAKFIVYEDESFFSAPQRALLNLYAQQLLNIEFNADSKLTEFAGYFEVFGEEVSAKVEPALALLPESTLEQGVNLLLLAEMAQYLAGQRKYFSPELICWCVNQFDKFGVSGYHRAVLLASLNIPFATLVTYGEFSQQIGYTSNAASATSSFSKNNPFPLVFPDHRLGSKFTPKYMYGDFSAGDKEAKKQLIEAEKALELAYPTIFVWNPIKVKYVDLRTTGLVA